MPAAIGYSVRLDDHGPGREPSVATLIAWRVRSPKAQIRSESLRQKDWDPCVDSGERALTGATEGVMGCYKRSSDLSGSGTEERLVMMAPVPRLLSQ